MNDISLISLPRIRRALRRFPDNLAEAAQKLKVDRRALVEFIHANPEILDTALEAEERALDKAETAIRAMLKHPDPIKRMTAAAFIARTSPRWRNP